MTQRTLLIDTDIFAYQFAVRHQEDTAFGQYLDFELACEEADAKMNELMELLKGDSLIICLSCREHNFRKDVLPTYKSNRSGVVPPVMLQDLKDYLAEEYRSYIRYSLEADDCMGILATHPHLIEGEKVIVSDDKDMRTIPGLVYSPMKMDSHNVGLIEVSTLDADRFLMWQTICGDSTDGYSGAKGVGKSSEYAQDVLFAETAEELWDNVLQAYASKRLTETDAIQQARCARILRACDYDFKNKEVKLWEPEMLLSE